MNWFIGLLLICISDIHANLYLLGIVWFNVITCVDYLIVFIDLIWVVWLLFGDFGGLMIAITPFGLCLMPLVI